MSYFLFSDAQVANLNHPGPGSFVDRDMVMRHFGGGIGHVQSTHHFPRGEQVVSETASIGSSEDEDDAEDLGGSDDNSMELGTVSNSSADEDSESELDTDYNGYDSL